MIDAIRDIATRAGILAMESYRGVFEQWEKSPGNPVSAVDLAVDQFLHEELRALDPEAGWLSEETVDNAERLMRSRVWVVDPIDGTRDFVRGRPGWCVSIALVEGGRVVAGVLDAPGRGEHWHAVAGGGAWRNGLAVTASQRAAFQGARIPADAVPKSETNLIAVDKPNSIALRIAMVAADEADLVIGWRWGHEWDIAAATLIAQEAGATVTDAHGQPLRFNSTKGGAFGVLASSAAIHQTATERLAERAAAAAAAEKNR